MPLLLLVITLISSVSMAGLNQIKVQNLNLDYMAPKGVGDFTKFSIDLYLWPQNYPLTLEKVGGSYVLRTDMADLTWSRPGKFFQNIESLDIKQGHADLGGKEHTVSGDELVFRPAGGGDYKLSGFKASCAGTSIESDLEKRLMEDCRELMLLTTDRAEVPGDFFLLSILDKMPTQAKDMDQPLEDFYVTSHQGDFFMYFLARFYVKAGLRAWGQINYEENFKVAVLKVNLIKFGIIPVTSMVMNELKERINDPRITIEPPFIRIRLTEL